MYKNTMQFDYNNTTALSEHEILKEGERLIPYIEQVKNVCLRYDYDVPEASLVLPAEDSFLKQSTDLAKKFRSSSLKLVVVIGIGGSNLGTQAIYEALYGHFKDITTVEKPLIIFLDTLNQSSLEQLAHFLKKYRFASHEYVINVVTKSGTTTETLANTELILPLLSKSKSRVVATTDSHSPLYDIAQKKGWDVLTIPKMVGGRYSVFSSVGLFPLALMGFDTKQLLEGALDAREKNTSEDIRYNPAAISALLLYLHHKKGYVVNNNFFFNPELESVGKWYRQLMGESIGKKGKGIVPMVSIGSNDHHSMLQLYLGGTTTIYTSFYWVEKNTVIPDLDLKIPHQVELGDLTKQLEDKKPQDVLRAIYKATKISYKKNNLPYSEIAMDTISEYSLGKLLQFKMIEMMYLGNLLGVDAFNQPNIEEYKEETRQLMKQL
jgi:glucose-6-phosphate isomerase